MSRFVPSLGWLSAVLLASTVLIVGCGETPGGDSAGVGDGMDAVDVTPGEDTSTDAMDADGATSPDAAGLDEATERTKAAQHAALSVVIIRISDTVASGPSARNLRRSRTGVGVVVRSQAGAGMTLPCPGGGTRTLATDGTINFADCRIFPGSRLNGSARFAPDEGTQGGRIEFDDVTSVDDRGRVATIDGFIDETETDEGLDFEIDIRLTLQDGFEIDDTRMTGQFSVADDGTLSGMFQMVSPDTIGDLDDLVTTCDFSLANVNILDSLIRGQPPIFGPPACTDNADEVAIAGGIPVDLVSCDGECGADGCCRGACFNPFDPDCGSREICTSEGDRCCPEDDKCDPGCPNPDPQCDDPELLCAAEVVIAPCAADGCCQPGCIRPIDPDCTNERLCEFWGIICCPDDGLCREDCPTPDPDCDEPQPGACENPLPTPSPFATFPLLTRVGDPASDLVLNWAFRDPTFPVTVTVRAAPGGCPAFLTCPERVVTFGETDELVIRALGECGNPPLLDPAVEVTYEVTALDACGIPAGPATARYFCCTPGTGFCSK